jgi:hypothetical protein
MGIMADNDYSGITMYRQGRFLFFEAMEGQSQNSRSCSPRCNKCTGGNSNKKYFIFGCFNAIRFLEQGIEHLAA